MSWDFSRLSRSLNPCWHNSSSTTKMKLRNIEIQYSKTIIFKLIKWLHQEYKTTIFFFFLSKLLHYDNPPKWSSTLNAG